MSEPWFDGNVWGWLPGTLLGVAGGIWGSLLGVLAPRGKGKTLLMGACFLMLAIASVMMAAGLVGWTTGQPWLVWYPLLLPGILTLAVLGPLGFVARTRYREAELRRMQAQELE